MTSEQTEKYVALKELSRTAGWKWFVTLLENRERDIVMEMKICEPMVLIAKQAHLKEVDHILGLVPDFLEEYESDRKQEKQ